MMELKAAPFYHAANELAEVSAWIAAGKSQVPGSINPAETLITEDKRFLISKLANKLQHNWQTTHPQRSILRGGEFHAFE